MENLLEDIEKIEFTTGINFSFDFDREFKLIASKLESSQVNSGIINGFLIIENGKTIKVSD